MSDHTKALVPIESWCYNSPEIRADDKDVDIGLLAEALIYYDQVLVSVGNQKGFAELLEWFMHQERLSDFLAMIKHGTIRIVDYGFVSAPLWDSAKKVYVFGNLQDELQAKSNSFNRRYLKHPRVAKCFGSKKLRQKFAAVLQGNVIEEKASDYGKPVEDTRKSFSNAQLKALSLQLFVDELYRCKGLSNPPEITAKVVKIGDQTHKTFFNVDLDELSALAGPKLNFGKHTILAGMGNSNKFLWSAVRFNCDLFMGNPVGGMVGNKMYESVRVLSKSKRIIDSLKAEVEFPDIRRLTNNRKIDLEEILRVRKKAKRFRKWIKEESDRDRNAIIAYHNEVAKELGYVRIGRKILSLFGVIGGGALGGLTGGAIEGAIGGAVGGVAGAASGYLFDLASNIGANWRPVVFGQWLKDRIERIVDEKDN